MSDVRGAAKAAMSVFGEASAVRPGEELEWGRVAEYLRSQRGLRGDLIVLQFPNGSANLTYLLEMDGERLVFRRPPFGEIAPGAHDMRREYRVLSRLWRVYPRAPRALLFCEDHAIVGSDFLVSEYRTGEMIWSTLPPSMATIPEAGRLVGEATVNALADLSLIDPASCDLADLGRPDGFVRRQVEGWTSRWRRVANPDSDEEMTRAAALLAGDLPTSQRVSILHNDFKIDNCQFVTGDPSTVGAVFDWDMCTLGDPLVDLGILLNYWPDPADSPGDRALHYEGLERLGLPTRDEVVRLYGERTGLDVSDIGWYEAFACWKTAIVLEQLYYRWAQGQSSDPRMGERHENVPMLARRALRLLTQRSA